MFGKSSDPQDGGAAANRKKMILRSAPRPPLRLRQAVQILTLLVILVIGWQFVVWVQGLEAGVADGSRPPGVEGFLPIASLMSLRHFFLTGQISPVHPAGLVLLVLILLTGLLLKKAFCSWLCPVGLFAEFLARMSHLAFKRRLKLPKWADFPLQSLKYLLLFFFVNAIFLMMTPGQIANFLNTPYNKVSDIKMLYFFTHLSPLAAGILVGLIVLSFLLPYLWCRYLCPYGALLGLVSLLSPLKVRRSAPDCTNCGRCAAVCPSFLDVDLKATVHAVECTGCLECVQNCPEPNALQVRGPGRRPRILKPAVFAALVVVLFYGGIQLARLGGLWASNVDQGELVQRVAEGLEGPQYDHVGRPPSRSE